MKAKAVAVTQPLVQKGPIGSVLLTPEEFIVYTARVSNPSNQLNTDTADRLLKYLVKHSHWSPFEQVDLTIEVETSRGIAAQILRHWSFRFQEFSLRYSTASGQEPLEIRLRHEQGNRQGSAEQDPVLTAMATQCVQSGMMNYEHLIAGGTAPECARFVLPLNTTTKLYMKGSVRSWMTYFWQRLDPHAQKEHRELAFLMFAEFEEHFPHIAEMIREGKPGYIEQSWM